MKKISLCSCGLFFYTFAWLTHTLMRLYFRQTIICNFLRTKALSNLSNLYQGHQGHQAVNARSFPFSLIIFVPTRIALEEPFDSTIAFCLKWLLLVINMVHIVYAAIDHCPRFIFKYRHRSYHGKLVYSVIYEQTPMDLWFVPAEWKIAEVITFFELKWKILHHLQMFSLFQGAFYII